MFPDKDQQSKVILSTGWHFPKAHIKPREGVNSLICKWLKKCIQSKFNLEKKSNYWFVARGEVTQENEKKKWKENQDDEMMRRWWQSNRKGKWTSHLERMKGTDLQTLLQRFQTLFLAGKGSACVAILRRNVEHLRRRKQSHGRSTWSVNTTQKKTTFFRLENHGHLKLTVWNRETHMAESPWWQRHITNIKPNPCFSACPWPISCSTTCTQFL